MRYLSICVRISIYLYIYLFIYLSVCLSEMITYCTNGKHENIMLIYLLATLEQTGPTKWINILIGISNYLCKKEMNKTVLLLQVM